MDCYSYGIYHYTGTGTVGANTMLYKGTSCDQYIRQMSSSEISHENTTIHYHFGISPYRTTVKYMPTSFNSVPHIESTQLEY